MGVNLSWTERSKPRPHKSEASARKAEMAGLSPGAFSFCRKLVQASSEGGLLVPSSKTRTPSAQVLSRYTLWHVCSCPIGQN